MGYSLVDRPDIENLTITGSGSIGTGNDADNILKEYGSYSSLYGGDGNDSLYAYGWQTGLHGGDGIDEFYILKSLNDISFSISDFESGEKIVLQKSSFASIGDNLSPDEFVIGTMALDSNDYFVYDDETGRLYYDQDGSESVSGLLYIAGITNGGLATLNLDNTSFEFV